MKSKKKVELINKRLNNKFSIIFDDEENLKIISLEDEEKIKIIVTGCALYEKLMKDG